MNLRPIGGNLSCNTDSEDRPQEKENGKAFIIMNWKRYVTHSSGEKNPNTENKAMRYHLNKISIPDSEF